MQIYSAYDYWKNCILKALENCNINATTEQIYKLASAIKLGHECYGVSISTSSPKTVVVENRKKVELENTDWAKGFKRDSPCSYEQALKYVLYNKTRYIIYKSDELDADSYVWAIAVYTDKEFWMDACKTKKEALAFCRKMGWKIKRNKK